MSKYLFTLICFCYALTPITAKESWADPTISNSDITASENDDELTIEFDDFPDNSLPDLTSLVEQSLSEKVRKKFKDFEPMPDPEDAIDKQCDLGNDVYGFPSAMVNGCVNIISGEYQEVTTDYTLPGTVPLTMQRFYCGAGCNKHSLLYGWQLSHGAKLLSYQVDYSDRAII